MDIIVKANRESGMLENLLEGDIVGQPLLNVCIQGSYGLSVIQSAIDQYNSDQSCLKWRPRTNEEDYVVIRDGAGCYSSIGRDTGPQNLVLGSTCYYKGVILHEMNHAAGFFHEQSRYDRDDYILVNWENVQDGKTRDFTKQQKNIMDTLGTIYDYGSIMHYGATTFSKNGSPTLVAKFNTRGTMGQRSGFSEMDIWKIKKLYGCENGDPPLPVWKQTDQTTPTTITTTKETKTSDHMTHSRITTRPSSIATSSTFTSTSRPTTQKSTSTTTVSATKKACAEKSKLPSGIPGKVQDFQVVLIENTLRVFWSPPCTSVPLSGYLLTIKNSQQHATITIAPNRQTHYIYTANHPGSRYEMTVTALSQNGRGETSPPISAISACGYDIVLPPNGTIRSLHSPYFLNEYYEPDVACQWNVRASVGQRLKIHFDSINLSDNTSACTEDYVMINDDRYCKKSPPGGYYITKERDAKIIFRSSFGSANKHGGFNISIEAIDTTPLVKQVINSAGVIGLAWDSPENTKNSSYNSVFKYRVLPNNDQEVLKLGPSVRQFVFPTGHNIGRQYELELSTLIEEEEGRPLKFTLRSDCGHNVTVDHPGRIQNPPSFGLYQPDVVCEWYFSPFQQQNFRLSISILDLELSPNCENDFLEIDSQKYCDVTTIPASALKFNDTVKVVFRSNNSLQRRGFSLQYGPVCTC
ncbi:uncharacterized protein LOC134282913 [Saccostrea cucullata]|uniref:uncharacterized protein LOC134282913 n=1 Tax=Saccostrea cuccullata TaxID=36930 RepID=UPI002ED5D142